MRRQMRCPRRGHWAGAPALRSLGPRTWGGGQEVWVGRAGGRCPHAARHLSAAVGGPRHLSASSRVLAVPNAIAALRRRHWPAVGKQALPCRRTSMDGTPSRFSARRCAHVPIVRTSPLCTHVSIAPSLVPSKAQVPKFSVHHMSQIGAHADHWVRHAVASRSGRPQTPRSTITGACSHLRARSAGIAIPLCSFL